jgi:hypothetical protein
MMTSLKSVFDANRPVKIGDPGIQVLEEAMRNVHTVIRNRQSHKQTRRLILLIIAVALVGTNLDPGSVTARNTRTQSPLVSQTADVPVLDGTFELVTSAAGDQGDSH